MPVQLEEADADPGSWDVKANKTAPLASLEGPADIVESRGRKGASFTSSISASTNVEAQSCPNISERTSHCSGGQVWFVFHKRR